MLNPQFNLHKSQEGDEGFYWNLSAISITVKDGNLRAQEVILATSGQKFETEEECRRQMRLAKKIAEQADL